MAVVEQAPTSGSIEQWQPAVGTNWTLVADESDATKVTAQGTASDYYGFAALPGDAVSVNTVSVSWRARDAGASAQARVKIHVGANSTAGPTRLLTSSFTTYTETLAAPTGSWTVSNASTALVQLELVSSGASDAEVPRVRRITDYQTAGGPPPVGTPLGRAEELRAALGRAAGVAPLGRADATSAPLGRGKIVDLPLGRDVAVSLPIREGG